MLFNLPLKVLEVFEVLDGPDYDADGGSAKIEQMAMRTVQANGQNESRGAHLSVFACFASQDR